MKNSAEIQRRNVLKQYEELPEEATDALDWWIETYIFPAKTCNYWYSSYGLKQIFEWTVDFYVSNDEFKGAMLRNGYLPRDPFELNWNFMIRKVMYDRRKLVEAYQLVKGHLNS